MKKTITLDHDEILALVVAKAKRELGVTVEPTEISVAASTTARGGSVSGPVEDVSIQLTFPPNTDPDVSGQR